MVHRIEPSLEESSRCPDGFDGGLGHIRNTYTGANVNDQFTVTDCVPQQLQAHQYRTPQFDHPYWKIERNIFRSDGYRSTTGISLSGLTDGTLDPRQRFSCHRVHVAPGNKAANNVYFGEQRFRDSARHRSPIGSISG